jgi:microcystin-dependent protein
MSTPFMGEMRIFSFNFAPKGWSMCNGQFLPINQNQALFSLLGTMYGGNGQTTFALPDLRGRVPIHSGGAGGWIQGQAAGQEAHTVTLSEMPAHQHLLTASDTVADATGNVATGKLLGQSPSTIYSDAIADLTTWAPASISNVGGSQPHINQQPYIVLNVCIALIGIFPSRN